MRYGYNLAADCLKMRRTMHARVHMWDRPGKSLRGRAVSPSDMVGTGEPADDLVIPRRLDLVAGMTH